MRSTETDRHIFRYLVRGSYVGMKVKKKAVLVRFERKTYYRPTYWAKKKNMAQKIIIIIVITDTVG